MRTTLFIGAVVDIEVVVISMLLPLRTLAMNSNTDDFPTPVSPTRRVVYDLFALFFDVLMISF